MHKEAANDYFEWSTDAEPTQKRLDSYVGHLCEHLINVTATSSERDNFRARLTTAKLGPLGVTAMAGSQHDAYRTSRQVARSKEQAYHVAVGLCGWRFSQRGSTMYLRPGDLVFADSRFEFTANWPTDHFALNVTFPREWLRGWIPNPAELMGQTISCETGWGRALSSYILKIRPEVAIRPPLSATVMSDQMGALLALAATDIPGSSSARPASYPVQYARILTAIVERCAELQLTAAAVAGPLGLSPRTLHRILASNKQTFGDKLMSARIELAKRMLEARAFAAVSIGEIGRRAGFADASHFARVFRSAVGVKPSQYRRLRFPS